MKYLVTGCAGFIGWKVTEFLIADGHTVIGIDNINDAYDVTVKNWRLAQLQELPQFHFNNVDLCNRPALEQLFDESYDAVINLAARAGVRQSVENPWVYIDTNITGTLNLLELCRDRDIKKFVLASTSSFIRSKESPSI